MAWVNRFGISRREQDEFALRSHQNAAKAHKDGIYVEEVRCGAMGYGPVADAMQQCDSSVFFSFVVHEREVNIALSRLSRCCCAAWHGT